MSVQKRRRLFRIGTVLFHSQRQRIAAEPGQKSVLRGHHRSHVPHHLRAAFRGECSGQGSVHESVIAFVGDIESGIAGITEKGEVAFIDDHAAERRRVAVEIFRRGMDDDVRAVSKRIAKYGRRQRVVHGKNDAVTLGDPRDFVEIDHDDGGIRHRFRKDEFGLFVDELVDLLLRSIGIEKSALDTQLGQRSAEEIERAPVHRLRADDVVPRFAQSDRRQKGGGHTRRTADSRDAAFERRDFVL